MRTPIQATAAGALLPGPCCRGLAAGALLPSDVLFSNQEPMRCSPMGRTQLVQQDPGHILHIGLVMPWKQERIVNAVHERHNRRSLVNPAIMRSVMQGSGEQDIQRYQRAIAKRGFRFGLEPGAWQPQQ